MMRAQSGDQMAYRDLLLQLRSRAVRLSAALLRSHTREPNGRGFTQDASQDLAQEILVLIHEKRHTYRAESPFLPWFHAIVRNKTLDALRASRSGAKNTVSIDSVAETSLQSDEVWSSLSNEAEIIEANLLRLIDQLPDKQKEVVKLTKLQGCTVSEVADRLKISVADVKVSTHRALQTLRSKLEEQ